MVAEIPGGNVLTKLSIPGMYDAYQTVFAEGNLPDKELSIPGMRDQTC